MSLKENKILNFTCLLILSLVILASLNNQLIEAQNNGVQEKIFQAYHAILDAERKGGNVTMLVKELNEAIELNEQAISKHDDKLAREAILKANKIIDESSLVAKRGIAESKIKLFYNIAGLITTAIFGLLAYFYLPRIFWHAWVKIKRRWKVTK